MVNRRTVITTAAAIIAVKVILATLSPRPFDFRNIAWAACFTHLRLEYHGPYTSSIYLMNPFYRLWLILPLDHPPVHSFWSGDEFTPSLTAFTLVFLFKLPLILADVSTGLLTRALVKQLGGSRRDADLAFILWLTNPYITYTVELDGKVDVFTVLLVTLSVILFLRGHLAASAATLTLGVILRFYPIILIPFFLIHLSRERMKEWLTFLTPIVLIASAPLAMLWKRLGVHPLTLIPSLLLGGNKEFLWFFGHTFTATTYPEATLSTVIIGYIFTFILFHKLRKRGIGRPGVVDACLSALLLYIALSHWNAGYPLWAFSLLTAHLASKGGEKLMGLAYGLITASILIYITTIWDIFPSTYMPNYVPQIEALANLAQTLHSWLYPGKLVTTFAKSILLAASTLYIARLLTLDFRATSRRSLQHSPKPRPVS